MPGVTVHPNIPITEGSKDAAVAYVIARIKEGAEWAGVTIPDTLNYRVDLPIPRARRGASIAIAWDSPNHAEAVTSLENVVSALEMAELDFDRGYSASRAS